jgi:hypothetical protein
MTGCEPVADLVLGIHSWQQDDAIDVLPMTAQSGLQCQFVTHPDKAHDLVRRVLFEIGRQQERRSRCQVAETDISEKRPFR